MSTALHLSLKAQCNVSVSWQSLSFKHTGNRLPEFHVDFLPGIYKLVLLLLWPGSLHIELHNVSALCFCCGINRLASCAPTVKGEDLCAFQTNE